MKLIKQFKDKFINFYDNLTNADSSWENRQYDFCLIFGQTNENKLPWITANWKSDFEPYFDLLIKQNGIFKEVGCRATKYKLEKRISKKEKEFIYHSEIKLGKLKWDEKSHEKWTMSNNMDNYFLDFESWSPSWTICEKRQSPPDVYISISNETDFENNRNIKFGYFIVVAIAKSLKFDSKPILKELSERINSKATILKTRKWGKSEKDENWTFVNGIQDTFSNCIYKGRNLHLFNFEELEFEPTWEVMHRAN
jgi:hypothetical protein